MLKQLEYIFKFFAFSEYTNFTVNIILVGHYNIRLGTLVFFELKNGLKDKIDIFLTFMFINVLVQTLQCSYF